MDCLISFRRVLAVPSSRTVPKYWQTLERPPKLCSSWLYSVSYTPDLGDPAAVRVQGDFGLLGGLTGGEVQSVQLQRPGGEAELGQGYRVLAHAQTDTRPG